MKKLLPVFSLLSITALHAQFSSSYAELRAQPSATLWKYMGADTSTDTHIQTQTGIHYLLPLYKFIYFEKPMVRQDTFAYYSDLAQSLAFVGDTRTIHELRKTTDAKQNLNMADKAEIKKLIDSTTGFTYQDARDYIFSQARSNRVVMINEAHDNPMHRAFTASLLEDLYKQGYRFLALEMLNNRQRRTITKIDQFSGSYLCEPAAAEMARKALQLGFTLVSYEDTAINHNVKQREYAQAENLAALIKRDPNAKVLVHAGYSHIDEAAYGDDFTPMAAYFKIISGINPLTVNQVNMSESSTSAFGFEVYRQWLLKHPVTASSVVLLNNKPIDISGLLMNDVYVLHPLTQYRNERPLWLGMNGNKEIPVTPQYRTTFMVQAYYLNEYSDKTLPSLIPADQTYNNAPNGLYYLYLHKGKYRIVFRDKGYSLLGFKDIEVN